MEPGFLQPPKNRPPPELTRSRAFGLGPVGTTAMIAAIAATSVAAALAFVIPRIVEQHLLASAEHSIRETVDEMAETIGPSDSLTAKDVERLQTEIEHSLLGREIVRVKIWDRTGTIIVSDEERLIGRTYPMHKNLVAAFGGEVTYEVPNLSRPQHEFERGLGALREYYVPANSGPQGVEIVFEIYELADHVVVAVGRIRFAIWIAL